MAHLAAPRIRSVASDVSEPYARVIDCALEFRREDRYESAAAMRKDVARAISELSAGVAPTLLAVSPPPVGEPTVELSQGDLESSPDLLEESIHIPKRRSILPWIALLVFCGIGGKLWLDARSTGTVPVAAPVLSTSPSFGPPLATTGIPAALHDSGTEAGTTLTDAAVASLAASADASREADVTSPVKPATPPPSASKNHRPTPTKVGPANVHKLKHGASNPTAQRHSQ
jgi:hypothetical protein